MKPFQLLVLAMTVSFCFISQAEAKHVRGYWRKHPHLHYVSSYRRPKSHSYSSYKHRHHR
jgi:hypothetical protein